MTSLESVGAGVCRRLGEFVDLPRELADHWPNAKSVVLHWDTGRQVLATDSAQATYAAIYGNAVTRGVRTVWNSARRQWQGGVSGGAIEPLRIDAPLPPDAVIVPQRSQEVVGVPYVMTIVSASERCVVKIFAKERRIRFDNEINAWRLARAAGLGHRVPRLLATGESATGSSWLISELVRNSGINAPLLGDWLWRRYLSDQILPELRRFYETSGVEMLKGSAWLKKFRQEIATHPMGPRLGRLADVAEVAGQRVEDDRIPSALIHGDLRPHNVHRHAGQWWLIDWSMSRRAPLLIDLWPNPSTALDDAAFSSWLRGISDFDAVPRRLRAPLQMYAHWQAPWFALKLDSDSLRFHVLATLLHRLARNHGSRSPLAIKTFKAACI